MNRKQRRAEKKQSHAAAESSGLGADNVEATALAQEALTVVTNLFAEALRHHHAGRLNEAERLYRQILQINPRHADAIHLLGVIAHQVGRNDVAVELIGKAIGINEAEPIYHINLANALKNLARLDDAVVSYREALRIRPDYAEAHYNLGIVLRDLGRLEEAITAYGTAIRIKPDLADAHYNLGLALYDQGCFEAAAGANIGAIRITPYYAEAHSNLGNSLYNLGRLDEAVTAYRAAICIQPDYAEAYSNLGNTLHDIGHLDDAVAAFGEALRIRPDYAAALSLQTHSLKHLCAWEGLADRQERVLDFVRRHQDGIAPLSLLILPSNPADQLACAKTFSDNYRVSPSAMFPHKTAMPGGRIRLGYFSADFHDHPTAYLIAELIERHDRHRFEVCGYSLGPDSTGVMRRRLIAGFDRFVDLRRLSVRDAAEEIHRDGIDILVDLKGHTREGRPKILAFRPAPIQVNFLGYPGSMGADFIDYIIADRFCIPQGQESFYTEKVVRLPDSYQPNDSKRTIGERTPSRAECELPEQGFVFCCFNNPYKLTPLFFDIWARLLAAVPGSVLWLLEANDGVKANLRRESRSRGIDPDRLVFAPRRALPDHLARHRVADLFLDTLPYNAHTTASDALWAGLPVLTCAGQTFAGRVAASLLSAVGLPELITETLSEYEALALKLATEPALLLAMRARLRKNQVTAALFDIQRYTRNIEAAYTGMWCRWCEGNPAAAFDVS